MSGPRIYLAGPMTGLQDFNYPAFHAEAARLRALGYQVENPAENPEPACGSWAMYMRAALRQLLTCDRVALLPGWEGSKGAREEVRVSATLGIAVAPCESIQAASAPDEACDLEAVQPC